MFTPYQVPVRRQSFQGPTPFQGDVARVLAQSPMLTEGCEGKLPDML